MSAYLPRTPLPPHQQIYCNRTLNLRQVKAIGYDMDYTLIHYHTEAWEARAYAIAKDKLIAQGWPAQALQFQPDLMIRGLIIDTELGNFLKVNTFGYVKNAFHGTQPMPLEDQRRTYASVAISLSDTRYVFMNTLFSLSEACLYAQLIDLLDAGRLPVALGYTDLFRRVQTTIDEAHVEGELKSEIVAQPEKFVELDPEVPLALLDQFHAGKKLMLITNSEWSYTEPMMAYVFDRFLPDGMHWRDLFCLVIASARKPAFFTERQPLFEIASDDGLLRPVTRRGGTLHVQPGVAYQGGSAAQVEEALGLAGDEILYVGDHIYGDVNVTKQVLRWRTALVLRDLEDDLVANEHFAATQHQLETLMADKQGAEFAVSNTRLLLLRQRQGYAGTEQLDVAALQAQLTELRQHIEALDVALRPMADAASRLANVNWGPLMRAGNDKSHLARQVERYADIYMSRVSNFVWQTPYGYVRALRGSLPHDPSMGASPSEATRGP